MIYWAKTIAYIMGYIWLTLWDILIKVCDKLGKSYGIYWAKTIGYFMGYIPQKLWDILGEYYGKYYGIYWFKIFVYIWQNLGIYVVHWIY